VDSQQAVGDFREARFGNRVLDAAVFEDCDLRGASFAGRRLDSTRFFDSKFASRSGAILPAEAGAICPTRWDCVLLRALERG